LAKVFAEREVAVAGSAGPAGRCVAIAAHQAGHCVVRRPRNGVDGLEVEILASVRGGSVAPEAPDSVDSLVAALSPGSQMIRLRFRIRLDSTRCRFQGEPAPLTAGRAWLTFWR